MNILVDEDLKESDYQGLLTHIAVSIIMILIYCSILGYFLKTYGM